MTVKTSQSNTAFACLTVVVVVFFNTVCEEAKEGIVVIGRVTKDRCNSDHAIIVRFFHGAFSGVGGKEFDDSRCPKDIKPRTE